MRFYKGQHKYYCGIDLRARKMYVCVLDQTGKTKNDKSDSYKIAALLRSGNFFGICQPMPAADGPGQIDHADQQRNQ